nr:hypothetical protein [Tanacetum cinerariifolium]
MDNKKRIVNLEYFREMLHICPRLHGQTFDELLFEEEILAFLRFLSHSREIRKLTDAQILWGMYHKKNVDFAYLLWEDFIYQVEHKDAKKSNEMYYPGFTKVIIHFFMTKDPSIPRRNKGNWHYVRDDQINSKDYKEYYAIASGAAPPKTKASVKKTKSSFDTTITHPTTVGTRLSTSAKGKQHSKSSKAKDEGTGIIPGVPNVPTNESDEEISWKSSDEDDGDEVDERSDDQNDDDDQDDDDQNDDDQDDNDDDQDTDNDGDDFVHPKLSIHEKEAKDGESFDPIVQTPENSDDEGNDDASLGLMLAVKKDRMQRVTMKNYIETSTSIWKVEIPDAGIDSLFMKTPWVDVQASTTVAPLTLTAPTLPPPTIPTISLVPQEPTPPTTDPTQAENEEFLNNLDENIQKIIKEQVKEQVKVQVFKILSKIKKTVNEQLEAEVLIRSSNPSKTSYAVAADLSEMELKKILIEKMESNKSIHRSDEQRNLYKALVDAYECEKIILDTYGNTVTLKRPRDDADKDEEPSAGSDRGSKRRREGKEPESTSAPKEKATKTTGKSNQGSKSH